MTTSYALGSRTKPSVTLAWRTALMAALLATYSIVLAIGSHSGFPSALRIGVGFPFLSDKPLGEDGFYMLTVAWNLALGEGLKYGLQGPTTGIQPLATFIAAAVAFVVRSLGGDKFMLVRVMILVGVVEQLLCAVLLGRLAARAYAGDADRSRFAAHVAFVTCVCSFTLFRWFTYGLETGLYLVGIAAFALELDAGLPRLRPRQALRLGLLAGLVGLCRLDFGVVFAVTLAWLLVRRQVRWPAVATMAAAASCIAFPWLGVVHEISGAWVPSSGTAQAGAASLFGMLERAYVMLTAMTGVIAPWTYPQAGSTGVAFGVVGLAVLTWFVLRARASVAHDKLSLRAVPGLRAMVPGLLALPLVYIATSSAPHFYQRYALPVAVIAIPVLSCVVVDLWVHHARAARWWIDVALGANLLLWALASLHLGRVGNPHSVSAGYLLRNTSPSDRIGAFQSGVIGYFHDNVFNLDGKMNHEGLAAKQHGDMVGYIDRVNIDVLVDWRILLHEQLPEQWLTSEWQTCGEEVPNAASVCLRRNHR
jgi:hypothetical protein